MTSSKPLLLSPSTSLLNLQSNQHQQQQQQPAVAVVRRRKPNITRSTSSSISSNLSSSDQYSFTSSTTHLTQPPHSADHYHHHHSNPSSTITSLFPKSIQLQPDHHHHHHSIKSYQHQHQNQSINSLLHHLVLPKSSHRHSTYLNHILSLFNSLTQCPTTTTTTINTSPTNLHRNSTHRHSNQFNRNSIPSSSSSTPNPEASINLESDGWTYLGTRQEVRLYTRELTSTEHFIISQNQPEDEFISTSIHESVSLPYFRGEGYLNGKWNSFDLAATLSSIPVRSMCDSKVDLSKSLVYQILDSNQIGDQLLKLSFKDQFPIGPRNQSLVQAFRPYKTSNHSKSSSFELSHQLNLHDDFDFDADFDLDADTDDDSGGVWVSTSVVDSLIPESEPNSRSWLSLCGFSFRPTSRPPTYSSIPIHPSQPAPSTSPESYSSQTRIPHPDRTSPIQPLSYHHSTPSNSSSNPKQRITSPSQTISGDLPSIVKRLSLTISPVHNQLNSSSLPNPSSLSKSLPNHHHHQNHPSNQRLSKNLSQIEWPTITYQTSILQPIQISKSSINLNLSPINNHKRNSLINFSSPIYSSISPTLNLSNSNLRRNRASSILSTSSPVHYSPTQRIRSGSSSTTHQELQEEEEEEEEEEKNGKKDTNGTHVSLVMKVYHGQKVPLSLVQYGFAPHLSRRNQPKGIKILSEEFNPMTSFYKILFKSNQPNLIMIRFHGSTFSTNHSGRYGDDDQGEYEIIVLRSEKWKVLFDKPNREAEDKENEDDNGGLWKGAGTVWVMCARDGLPVEVMIRKIGKGGRERESGKTDRVLFGFGGSRSK
ncbi:uncharacterized protein MELLADRAFT_79388 [Melampsora larici-populina 98AG31]|uniref:Uncharacterized protein n=1 Tax=Melampsora larici-populina (strain 98AG31 / pathotype 3-4-7) TaxID=747676 RepID=F4S686_MELLP|nr:uncharacterized protein MELLADRAFT_79388 [Melampsora larici-populina 98AG31]EGF99771.1 hypothetical protein MELLADRAFT_79388 [Melampsora larici-populina 98AG31]